MPPRHPPPGDPPPRRQLSSAEFEHLERDYGPLLLATARHALGTSGVNGFAPDDLVQETLLKLAKDGLPDPCDNVPGYVSTMIRNLGRDVHRKHREDPATEEVIRSRSDRSEDPAYQAEQNVIAQQCWKLANSDLLTKNERFAFFERVRKQRPAIDVARDLGVQSPRVAQLVNSALRKLRRALGEDQHGS